MERCTNCKNCQEDYLIKSSTDSRHELENDLGRYFQQQCPKCLSKKEYHVNDVYARISKKQLITVLGIALIITAIFTTALWQMGVIASLSLAIPFVIVGGYYQSQSKAVSTFNRHLIKRDE